MGHGTTLTVNIPPERTGQMNASVAAVMAQVGRAINNTFHTRVAAVGAPPDSVSGPCIEGFATIKAAAEKVLPRFDYVMSREDMGEGQRIADYSIEFETRASPGVWKMLVKAGGDHSSSASNDLLRSHLGDPIAGDFPRDMHVGSRRIDVPQNTSLFWYANTSSSITAVRFNCLKAYAEPVTLRSFSLHARCVEWIDGCGLNTAELL